jgi:DNA-binding response OmpR family regulator
MEQTENLSAGSILLVEDEPEFQNQVRHVLEEAGFAVTVAQSAKAALKLLRHEPPQLVLTEISLPDRPGIDILMALESTYPDILFIMMTVKDDVAAAREAIRQGAFDYIQKPWDVEDLLSTCRRAAETVRLRAEIKRLKRATSTPLENVSQTLRASSRPERAAMERAALVRVTQFMGDAISKASTRVLEQALGEPESDATFTDVLTEVLVKEAAGGDWAAALLRGAHVQRDLLREAGGTLNATEVADLLGISRAAVDKRRRQSALLGLRLPNGDFAYPAAQFAKNDALPGLSEVLRAFHVKDPWMQLDVLLTRDQALDGRTGFQSLADGDVERVKTAVSSFGEHGL